MIRHVGILDRHKSAANHDKLVRDEKQLDTELIGFLLTSLFKDSGYL